MDVCHRRPTRRCLRFLDGMKLIWKLESRLKLVGQSNNLVRGFSEPNGGQQTAISPWRNLILSSFFFEPSCKLMLDRSVLWCVPLPVGSWNFWLPIFNLTWTLAANGRSSQRLLFLFSNCMYCMFDKQTLYDVKTDENVWGYCVVLLGCHLCLCCKLCQCF